MTTTSPTDVLVAGAAAAALDHTLRTACVPFASIYTRQESPS